MNAIADKARLYEVVVIERVHLGQVAVQVFTFKIKVVRDVDQIQRSNVDAGDLVCC